MHMTEKALKCLKVQLGLYSRCDYCRFSMMMKSVGLFIDMGHFYIAAFITSSKLNDLSQIASNVVSSLRVVLSHSCI